MKLVAVLVPNGAYTRLSALVTAPGLYSLKCSAAGSSLCCPVQCIRLQCLGSQIIACADSIVIDMEYRSLDVWHSDQPALLAHLINQKKTPEVQCGFLGGIVAPNGTMPRKHQKWHLTQIAPLVLHRPSGHQEVLQRTELFEGAQPALGPACVWYGSDPAAIMSLTLRGSWS